MSNHIQIPFSVLRSQNYMILKMIYDPSKNEKVEEIKIEHLIAHKNKIRIFGNNFVNNNKDKYRIIYKNKEYKLKEYFEEIDKNYNSNNLIKLRLKIINHIINLNYIFEDCNTLISVSENIKRNTQKINIISSKYCSQYFETQLKVSNDNYKNYLYKEYNSSISLSPIDSFNTANNKYNDYLN